MLMISTSLLRRFTLPAFILLWPAMAIAANWPVTFEVDLSSGFGDYRSGHFHFGVDIRTGGVTGKPVVSPVDGYVWRVRTSYTGYGKALYIKGNDGYTYVMAHLSEFAPRIDGPLKEAQYGGKRYYQDLYFDRDSIKVKSGELVAYSGQTGIGAPHLHFEKRNGDTPLNPLAQGHRFTDRARPVFKRIGFQLTDDHSLFPNGGRKIFLDAVETGQPGKYKLDTALYFNSPVGLLADCYDRMRTDGMRQSVYRLSVYVDDELVHESRLDSTSFATDPSVSLEYDLAEATDDRKTVRRLYREPGNEFGGCRPAGAHNGIIGAAGMLTPGVHEIRIVAEDAFDNRSEVRFPLLWGPPEELYALDSTVKVAADTTDFYFTASDAVEAYAIDSVIVWANRGDLWAFTPDGKVSRLEDGRIKARVTGFMVATVPLRLAIFTREGGLIRDRIFNGIDVSGGKFEATHEIVDDGLLLSIRVFSRRMSESRVELYYRDSLLGVEYPQPLSIERYECFIKPQPKYARIDRYHVVLSLDTAYMGSWSDTLNIIAAGLDPSATVPFDDHTSLQLERGAFLRPQFLELKSNFVLNRGRMQLNSDHYRILPESFPMRRNVQLRYDIPSNLPQNRQSGLCWLDEDKNRWIWLNNRFDDSADVLTAEIGGGGSFAAVFDFAAPTLSRLSVSNGATYQNRQPAINFEVADTLSGIGDDRNIVIELDGEWLIPEYEPETGRVRTRPRAPLAPGKHHLGIMVTDRAGNLTEKYLNFFIKPTKKEQAR